ncbi:MAG: hypothetical protein HRT36_07125 [Alphaproteobacteria bacterium]|nr:hypothetical protein [Alphaproteobacteria bacterium]
MKEIRRQIKVVGVFPNGQNLEQSMVHHLANT